MGACHSQELRPAVLKRADPASLASLRQAAAELLGRGVVDLGPEDPLRSPVISVLPPRPSAYQDRNPAMPVQLQIMLQGEQCVLRRPDTDTRVVLVDVACAPAEPK